MGRLAASLLVAVVIPGVVFYVALVASGITPPSCWRSPGRTAPSCGARSRDRPMSGLLALTVTVMTAKTIFTLLTGNTFVYFFQPVVTDAAVGALFLGSLATARPVVARLAPDFYPMTPRSRTARGSGGSSGA